jgi:hypothetical protein
MSIDPVRVRRFGRSLIAAGVCCLAAGCAAPALRSVEAPPRQPCRRLAALYRNTGFTDSQEMKGRATFDVEQYRIRGQFSLSTTPAGDFVFELSSSVMFGGQREDLMVSMADGVLQILDRERGQYYEGTETADILSFLVGQFPPCGELERAAVAPPQKTGETTFTGRLNNRPVKIIFKREDGLLNRLEWPILFTSGRWGELEADYRWSPGPAGEPALSNLTMKVDSRGWRIILQADQ